MRIVKRRLTKAINEFKSGVSGKCSIFVGFCFEGHTEILGGVKDLGQRYEAFEQ